MNHPARHQDAAPPRYPTVEAMIDHRRPTTPVTCLYPEVLRRRARAFLDGFPGSVLYAVKANPHLGVLQVLHAAGVDAFDTASLAEIRLVRGQFPDARCCFMAPSKLVGAAEAAYRDYGVRDFVADHESEVRRLLSVTGADAVIHVRMKAFDPGSVYELSSKFGAEAPEAARLLALVAAQGRRPGLAFNVGSLCQDPAAYARAIEAADEVAREARVPIAALDVGGGFPCAYPGLAVPPMGDYFAAIGAALARADLPADCAILCEPGRALVAEAQSLVVQVILVKEDMLFLNDGVYGSFRELEISKQAVRFPVRAIRLGGRASTRTMSFHVFGPTCDTLDVFPAPIELPEDLAVGDWLEFGLAGAYSNAMKSSFNGFGSDDWALIAGSPTSSLEGH